MHIRTHISQIDFPSGERWSTDDDVTIEESRSVRAGCDEKWKQLYGFISLKCTRLVSAHLVQSIQGEY